MCLSAILNRSKTIDILKSLSAWLVDRYPMKLTCCVTTENNELLPPKPFETLHKRSETGLWLISLHFGGEWNSEIVIKGEAGSLASSRIYGFTAFWYPLFSAPQASHTNTKIWIKIQKQMQNLWLHGRLISRLYDRLPSVLCQSYPSAQSAPYASVATKRLFCCVCVALFECLMHFGKFLQRR